MANARLGVDVYQSEMQTTLFLVGLDWAETTESQWRCFEAAIKAAVSKYIISIENTCTGIRINCNRIRNIKRILRNTNYPFMMF